MLDWRVAASSPFGGDIDQGASRCHQRQHPTSTPAGPTQRLELPMGWKGEEPDSMLEKNQKPELEH